MYNEFIDTNVLDGVFTETESFFGTPSEIIDKIISGEMFQSAENIPEAFLNLLFGSLKSGVKYAAALLGIAVLLSVCENLKILSPKNDEIATLGGKIVFTAALATLTVNTAKAVTEALVSMRKLSEIMLPLVYTALAGCGSTSFIISGTLLNTVISSVNSFVLPILFCGYVFKLAENLFGRFGGFASFYKSLGVWLIGGILTVFSGIITVQGLNAELADGLTLRSVKYTISSVVPIIGGSVSESVSTVISGAMAVKGALGITGILIVASVLLVPILNLLGFVFALRLFGAVGKSICSDFCFKQFSSAAEYIEMLVILLFGLGIIWFVFFSFVIKIGSNVF